jgi:hypothetical protein
MLLTRQSECAIVQLPTNEKEKYKMEITETREDYIYENYTAHTYFGEYGAHTDWFKGEEFINEYLVPEHIQDQHNEKIQAVMY